jgi:hypothetical protein
LMLFLCQIRQKSHQARYTTPNKRTWRISTSTYLHEILCTDSQDMLVLSSTVASRYYNCCTDGSTSPGNYGYPLVVGNDSAADSLIFTCLFTMLDLKL